MRDAPRSASSALVKVVEAPETSSGATREQQQPDAVRVPTAEQRARFEALYRLLFPRLLRYAGVSLGRNRAFDAVQDALADIWSRWVDIDGTRPSNSFFFTAVRNRVAVTIVRTGTVPVPFSDLPDDAVQSWSRSADSPDAALEYTEVAALLEATIASLPKRCRAVWVSMRDNEMRYVEVASALGLSPVTVRRHMMRALQLLHHALAEAGYREANALPPKLPRSAAALLPAPATSAPTPAPTEDDAHD